MTDSASPLRLPAIDAARGLALVAMIHFHFTWDLEMFGLLSPGTMASTPMVVYARAIAGSFLVLVGASLWLAHRSGIRWRAFGWRMLQVAGAAALVSLGTRFAVPQAWIFFGILHQIAVASLLALAFLRLPAWAALLAGAGLLFGRPVLASPAFDAAAWWWTGLNTVVPTSVDYVPVFPFTGAVLIGLGLTKLADRAEALARLARPPLPLLPFGWLAHLGRHSLVVYLLHQPVLVALLWLAVTAVGHI